MTHTFSNRHIGPSTLETNQMLAKINVKSLDELIQKTIPETIRLKAPLNLPPALSEKEALLHLEELAKQNKNIKSFIGQGYYNTDTPTVILRNVLENPGWYTQYTPYQAEIAQGRLEALLNFQTVICELTGLDIANGSLLDEATAAAEAMTLFFRTTKSNSTTFFVSNTCYPQTIAVIETRAKPLGITVLVGDTKSINFEKTPCFGTLIQYPNCFGHIENYEAFIQKAHQHKGQVAIATDLLALTLLKTPGELGADIALGSSQRFGVPMGFGGPHAAFFAAKKIYARQLPGRIIGVTIDKFKKKAYRMALQTREQHIRRDKATSNICTAQALLAIVAAMYASYHGEKGLKSIAERCHHLAKKTASILLKNGLKLNHSHFFDTLSIHLPEIQKTTLKKEAESKGFNFNYFFENTVTLSFDECSSEEDSLTILNLFKPYSQKHTTTLTGIPQELARHSSFLQQSAFTSYQSETNMLRYLKQLENKDLSLTSSMIPLGSCTMKLNASTEMIPITWPAFANSHPFAPLSQNLGYQTLIKNITEQLKEITGFYAISLQPNSGAQGEYAGLLCIKNYFEQTNQKNRNIVLIPTSAHGTNPASAALAGLKIVPINCDENGNIDVEDIQQKAKKHQNNLAALMVTYPSTHGVFESTIKTICSIVHNNGGLVYMDGANMNAQVGLTSPCFIGADVCHLNLHKTFSIPHGGGGPGMGPIGVTKTLAPYLPNHPIVNLEKKTGAISAAPWGSALVLIISYAYICMMGEKGLTHATKIAILNANYIKARLEDHYSVLFTGENNTVAHELIIDCRPFKKTTKIDVEDIAKRLMDYSFHAPTISWPVPGTMMIEPTESESKHELDRFCDAMISIRNEIRDIKENIENNVLKNAPHTTEVVTQDNWPYTYPRSLAAYPIDSLKTHKFWPSVSRINQAYGDRNLMCTCGNVEEYT